MNKRPFTKSFVYFSLQITLDSLEYMIYRCWVKLHYEKASCKTLCVARFSHLVEKKINSVSRILNTKIKSSIRNFIQS